VQVSQLTLALQLTGFIEVQVSDRQIECEPESAWGISIPPVAPPGKLSIMRLFKRFGITSGLGPSLVP
jgi:hypothetical protein